MIIITFFGCQNDAQAKLEAENIELVKKYWDALNTNDIEVFKELYDKNNYSNYNTFDSPNPWNYEKTIENIEWNLEFVPEGRSEVINIFASGDKVTSMVIIKGTFTKDVEGWPPATGQEFNTSILNVMRIQNGKIIEEWQIFDNLKFFKQLGMELKIIEE